MRIGMAQMDISWENIEDNKKKVEQFFKKAEENQVDCLVFPEMTLTGFSMNVEETGEKSENQKHFFVSSGISMSFEWLAGENASLAGRKKKKKCLYWTALCD